MLSVYIITKNEEKYIKNCLESIKNIADEIIIVDGFSADKTVKISKEYTDKIYLHKFSGSFAKERMYAISKCCGEWILHIDADETISNNLQEYIRNIIKTNEYSAHAFARKNYYDESGKKWTKTAYFPDYQVRLFKRDKAKYTKTVCEGAEIEGDVIYEPYNLFINHYVPNKYSLSNFKNQHLRSIKLQSKWSETKKYQILNLPFIFLHHFIYMFIKHKWYKDGFIGFKASIVMSLYISLVNYYKIFNTDIILTILKPFEWYNPLQKRIDSEYKTKFWIDI